MYCDEEKYQIKEYLNEIKNNSDELHDNLNEIKINSDELLEDFMKYNYCGICKKYWSTYFCNGYNGLYKNICNKCYLKCETEKYEDYFINLAEMRKSYLSNIKEIKNI